MTTEEMNEKIYKFLNREDILKLLDNDNFDKIYPEFFDVCEDTEEICRFSEFLYIDCKIEIFKFLTYIPSYMFYKSKLLPSYLYIPDNIKVIGVLAFYGCESLRAIYIEDNCYKIGTKAFANCTKLEKIRFPKTLTKIENIGNLLLANCNSLKEIYVVKDSNAEKWCTLYNNNNNNYKVIIQKEHKNNDN